MSEEIVDNIHKAKGVIHKIYETTAIQTKKGIMNKKVIVIETRSRKGGWDRTSFHALECFGDDCSKYDYFNVEDEVTYEYRCESRCTKTGDERWFTSLYLVALSKKFMFAGANKEIADANQLNPVDKDKEEDVRFQTYDPNDTGLPF
jgi:hypothetical protein